MVTKAGKSIRTNADERSWSVYAFCMKATMVKSITFVDVVTVFLGISRIARFALTKVTSIRVNANGMKPTWCCSTLVDIY